MDILESYKYCPRCGAGFEKKSNFLHCPNCGLSFYMNPKPTTTVVIVNDNDEYLLVERAVEPAKGFLDFAGGFVEENETFEENAKREIREELGIKLGDLYYIGSHTEPYLYQNIKYPTLAAVFISKLLPGSKLDPADDVAGYIFFKPEDIPMNKLAFKAMEKDIEFANKFLKIHKL